MTVLTIPVDYDLLTNIILFTFFLYQELSWFSKILEKLKIKNLTFHFLIHFKNINSKTLNLKTYCQKIKRIFENVGV